MNPFDERIRRRAAAEDCPIPEGFDARLNGLLEELPQRGGVRRGSRALRRGLIAAAVAAAVCVGGVAAAPTALRMAGDAVDYFQIPEEFRRLSEEIAPQPFSAAVGASVSDQGYTLTVEGIALDDAFVTLYYTITGEEPIPLNGRGKPNVWSLRLMAEGDYLEFWDSDVETELEDENTLRVIQRSPVLRALPDVVELEVYSDELVWGRSGTWHLALSVDKSAPAAESLVAEPGVTFNMEGHRVTADKVAVAPSGGALVLTEAGESPPLTRFLLRDDRGNVLPHKRYGTVSRPILPVSNFVEFFGGRADMASITIVPWQWVGEGDNRDGSHRVSGALDALPLTDEHGLEGYTLLSLDVGADRAVGVFRTGETWTQLGYFHYGPEFTLLGRDGAPVELGDTYLERTLDRETGVWTTTITYPDATPEQAAQIAGVSFWQPNDTIELLEDQAVTIPLT